MINLAHRVWVVDAEELRRRTEVEQLEGKILRRITSVYVVAGTRPKVRRVTLNCGHHVDVECGLRLTVGKLTGCPECR